ncbi:hypothetical protein [Succinivibrio dextrinosolvens]|uniref:hypothetical protein n=1 Tax=Succinivibrio dextrinosolvens TaxID=83771 RepID=UPI00241CA01C|nr:hypothetical protein [Succinivibrio dextrinosolvens]MBE6424185.1 hypothetical protein [Succinivibrio dextrinosolvens]
MSIFPNLYESFEYRKKISRLRKPNYIPSYAGGWNCRLSPATALKQHFASGVYNETKFYLRYDEDSSEYSKKVIQEALESDPAEVVKVAVELYEDYEMRLNPIFLLMYMLHPYREWRDEIREGFKRITKSPMDIKKQFDLYLFFYESKNKLPSFLKRLWKKRIEGLSRYQLQKYKNKANLFDIIKICHAHNSDIDELLKNGCLKLSESEATWEELHSSGKSWSEILNTIEIPYLALLRNLRGIIRSVKDPVLIDKVIATLKASESKLQPYRYYIAYETVRSEDSPFKDKILSCIASLLDSSLSDIGGLEGKTLVLSDNSNSTHTECVTGKSQITCREINNLSALITAVKSDYAKIYPFSVDTFGYEVSKTKDILSQMVELDGLIRKDPSMFRSTQIEKSLYIALFDSEVVYDNVFIYTDAQDSSYYSCEDVIKSYLRLNPKLNVFVVQTAGYATSLLPVSFYRVGNLCGFTGKEIIEAKKMIKEWDEFEKQNQAKES